MVAIPKTQIRIVGIPPGEAPLSIRKEWVGLILPLAAGYSSAFQVEASGVMSSVKHDEPEIGYLVRIEDAIAALAKKSPHAALWWRNHAGRLIRSGSNLIFQEHVCQLLKYE
jgi:hypothetical protein